MHALDTRWLQDFATRYAAAWCSHDAARVAAFFAEHGTLTINGGEPSVGRQAIAAAAQAFITTFPDMVVSLDGADAVDGCDGDHAIFRWTLTGTNTGPGGTGHVVRVSGRERWTFGDDGLIDRSRGEFDEAEYQRQIAFGVDASTRSHIVRLADAQQRLPGPAGEHALTAWRRGSLDIALSMPQSPKSQTPHEQDEIYLIIRGRGVFVHDGRRDRFEAGDLLFVAAGVEHQFVEHTTDLAVWRVFYGPVGGEVAGTSGR